MMRCYPGARRLRLLVQVQSKFLFLTWLDIGLWVTSSDSFSSQCRKTIDSAVISMSVAGHNLQADSAIIQQVNQLWLKWCVSSTSLCFSWLEESNLIWIWKNRLFLNRSRVFLWSGYCKTVSYIYFLCFAYFLTFIVNVLHAGWSPISSPVLNKRIFCDVAHQVSFGFKVGVWLLHFHVKSRGIIVPKS
jgi:hypothetical protein